MLKNFKPISLILLAGATCFPASIFAETMPSKQGMNISQQNGKVTGTVVDDLGPVAGASVVVKGTTNGNITDMDGNFTLEGVKNGDIIQISFIGYTTQEIKYTGQSTLQIKLAEDTQKLEEVVVVGYGVQKKVNLTGAVGIADSEILEDRPIGNIAQGLQGAIPNLNIDFASGNPNAATTFNVRGATSLNGGQALLLVDGVETSDLSLLNPQDIESVSVLKDAASASIYGARAAFGVVLITTKKGKKEQKVQINYNNNFSWSMASRLPDGVSSDKWIRAMNQANVNNGSGQYFKDEHVQAVDDFIAGRGPSAFYTTDNSITAAGQWAYAGNTIAKPEIPKCERWSDLERLNKEKELVGIYLSAHPLDEYRIILTYVCNTGMAEINDKENLVGKDLLFGGIVTDFREGMTKKGNPYGIIKIEDFTGSGEIALFGKDYVDYSKFGKRGMYLLIKARVEDRYNSGRLSLSIGAIQLLQEEKDRLIEKISITVPIHDLDEPTINELSTLIKNNPGQSLLYFKVVDGEHNVIQNFFSQNIRLNVTRNLVEFLQTNENMDFKING